jgi:hypothetical protein
MGGDDPMDLANLARLRTMLTKPENRYLVRELCWILAVDGVDSYVLTPSDPTDILLLVEALRPNSGGDSIDSVIGSIADPPPGTTPFSQIPLPLLIFDQLHSFDIMSFAKGLSGAGAREGEGADAAEAKGADAAEAKGAGARKVDVAVAVDLLQRLTSVGGSIGMAPEHRALNYISLRYPGVYILASKKAAEGFSLQAVRFLRAPVVGERVLIDVLLTFISNADSRAERWSVKVDVTDKYPFLRGALSPHLLSL